MKLTRPTALLVLFAALLLATVSCSLPGQPGPAQPEATLESSPGEPPVEEPTQPPPDDGGDAGGGSSGGRGNDPGGGNTSAPATTSVEDVSRNLDGLESYRSELVFSFSGQDADGNEKASEWNILEEYIRDLKHQYLSMHGIGDIQQASDIELYNLGADSYFYQPDLPAEQRCVHFPAGQEPTGMGQLFKASDLIGSLDNAKLVASDEIVNGVRTDHYTLDESVLSNGDFTSITGDVWIAQEDLFVVRYSAQATGNGSAMGAFSGEGTYTWAYNLDRINNITAIELPEECIAQQPSDPGEIPIPSNATQVFNMGDLITFQSPDEPSVIGAYYKTELEARGWTSGDHSLVGDIIILDFTREGSEVSVTILRNQGLGGSLVTISITTP